MVELDGAEFEPEPNLKLRVRNQRMLPSSQGSVTHPPNDMMSTRPQECKLDVIIARKMRIRGTGWLT